MYGYSVYWQGKVIQMYVNGTHWFDVKQAAALCLKRSVCLYHDLYMFTMISICLPRSLCLYHDLYVFTMISMSLP